MTPRAAPARVPMTATSTASSIDFGVQTDAKVFSEGDIYVHDEKLCVRNMPAPLFQNRNSSSVEERNQPTI